MARAPPCSGAGHCDSRKRRSGVESGVGGIGGVEGGVESGISVSKYELRLSIFLAHQHVVLPWTALVALYG